MCHYIIKPLCDPPCNDEFQKFHSYLNFTITRFLLTKLFLCRHQFLADQWSMANPIPTVTNAPLCKATLQDIFSKKTLSVPTFSIETLLVVSHFQLFIKKCPRHPLVPNTHMSPTPTCPQHPLVPNTHMSPTPICPPLPNVPNTHMSPTHNFLYIFF